MKVWELIIIVITLLCWCRAYYIDENDLVLDDDNPLDYIYTITFFISSLFSIFYFIYIISIKINWEFLNYTII